MLSKGFMALLCMAALIVALPVVPVAGEEMPVSLSNRSLSIAVAAREEFVRHMGNQDFSMQLRDEVPPYHASISYERYGRACDAAPSSICDGRCGRCFQLVVAPDLKIVGRQWGHVPDLERAGQAGAIPRTMVTWLGEPATGEKPPLFLSSRTLSWSRRKSSCDTSAIKISKCACTTTSFNLMFSYTTEVVA